MISELKCLLFVSPASMLGDHVEIAVFSVIGIVVTLCVPDSISHLAYVLTCVCDNWKILSRISFQLDIHMYLGQERNPIMIR